MKEVKKQIKKPPAPPKKKILSSEKVLDTTQELHLINYVTEMTKKGRKYKSIKEGLLERGWTKKDSDSYLAKLIKKSSKKSRK